MQINNHTHYAARIPPPVGKDGKETKGKDKEKYDKYGYPGWPGHHPWAYGAYGGAYGGLGAYGRPGYLHHPYHHPYQPYHHGYAYGHLGAPYHHGGYGYGHPHSPVHFRGEPVDPAYYGAQRHSSYAVRQIQYRKEAMSMAAGTPGERRSSVKSASPGRRRPPTTLRVKTVAVPSPFQDQKPGTSGLRKKVKVFQQQHYLECFVQSIFNALPKGEYQDKVLVVSGDGRYHNDVATQTIIQIAFANGVRKVYVGQHCLLSTPAVSSFIRRLNSEKGAGYCFGGIVLSASHNPGGPTEDFGIKFNGANGAPSAEGVTDEIFAQTKKIKQYSLLEGYDNIPTDYVDTFALPPIEGLKGEHIVEVVDNAEEYVDHMSQLFDFGAIQRLINRRDFSMCFDGMHGVSGPYAQVIFGEIFGVQNLMRCNVLPDFGGCHPDPNLTYAKELVELMGVTKANRAAPEFGAACDGDADRNMILGKGFFVTPSDSVAIIVANHKCIPFLAKGLTGAARSMPTSGALD